MGIETNPNKVDDLNSAWPASNEPAREGFAHLRNIKQAVKARANVLGQYGVTTLSNDIDSDAEDKAATPKAIQTLRAEIAESIQTINELAAELEAAFEDLDTSVPNGGLLPAQLWLAAPGSAISLNAEKDPMIPEIPGNNFIRPFDFGDDGNFPTGWITMAGFTCLNGGQFTLSRRLARRVNTTTGSLQTRVLVNGSTNLLVTEDTRASMQSQFGGNWWGVSTFTDNLTVNPGDRIEFQCNVTGSNPFLDRDVNFQLIWLRVLTAANRPLLANTYHLEGRFGPKYAANILNVSP